MGDAMGEGGKVGGEVGIPVVIGDRPKSEICYGTAALCHRVMI